MDDSDGDDQPPIVQFSNLHLDDPNPSISEMLLDEQIRAFKQNAPTYASQNELRTQNLFKTQMTYSVPQPIVASKQRLGRD